MSAAASGLLAENGTDGTDGTDGTWFLWHHGRQGPGPQLPSWRIFRSSRYFGEGRHLYCASFFVRVPHNLTIYICIFTLLDTKKGKGFPYYTIY